MWGRLPPIFHHVGAIARLRALAQHPPGSYEPPNMGTRVYGSARALRRGLDHVPGDEVKTSKEVNTLNKTRLLNMPYKLQHNYPKLD